jgi:hypothetical protein
LEIAAAIETKRAGEHNKPIAIINTNGYFNYLIGHHRQHHAEGFAEEKDKDIYYLAKDAADAIQHIESSFAPKKDWIAEQLEIAKKMYAEHQEALKSAESQPAESKPTTIKPTNPERTENVFWWQKR